MQTRIEVALGEPTIEAEDVRHRRLSERRSREQQRHGQAGEDG
jgi:hypothetical protein